MRITISITIMILVWSILLVTPERRAFGGEGQTPEEKQQFIEGAKA
jgi:hypothetical protein